MDLVLFSFHQTHCFRLCEYFRLKDVFSVFPNSFADEAIEVGPHTNHAGPKLTLFKSVKTSPEDFIQWFQTSFIRRQVGRVYWLDQSVPAVKTRHINGPVVELHVLRKKAVSRVHVCQPMREELLEAVIAAGMPADATAIKIYATPRSLEAPLADQLLDHGFELHPKTFSHVLQVVQVEEGFRWSYLPARQLWRNPWNEPRCFDSSVASAVMKIDEALQLLGLAPAHQAWEWQEPPEFQHWHASDQQQQQLQEQEQQQQQENVQEGAAALKQQQEEQGPDNGEETGEGSQQQQQQSKALQQLQKQQIQDMQQQQQQQWHKLPSLGRSPMLPVGQGKALMWAIDVGAAPGAWSSYLATTCCSQVIAVDPAKLNPATDSIQGLHHLQAKGEEAMADIAALLGTQKADLLVCDINQHPNDVRAILQPMLVFLKPGGWLVMTLKFFGYGRDRSRAVESLEWFFREQLAPGNSVWLMANTTCERTYLAQRL